MLSSALIFVALILGVLRQFQAKGQSLTDWALISLAVALVLERGLLR